MTANKDVANLYADYLRQSIGVVACNKIACSSDFENYKLLKRLSLKYNAPYLFETNVGAGLPIIDTLNNEREAVKWNNYRAVRTLVLLNTGHVAP